MEGLISTRTPRIPTAKHRTILWTLVGGLALLLLWPAAALAADSFDLQSAINACPAGGTVSVPAGTFTVTNTIVLKSGITIQGQGSSQSILYMPSQPSSGKTLLSVDGVSSVAIRDLGLKSDSHDGYVWAIQAQNYSGLTIERVRIDNCYYGLKAAGTGNNLVVRDFTVVGTGAPMHLARITGGSFTNLDLSSDATVIGDWAAHGIYIDADNHNLAFTNVKIGTVESYALHMYSDYGWSQPSNDITFDGLTINSRRAVMIGDGFDRVTIRNLNAVQQLYDDGALMFGAPHNVLIDGFTVSGGWYAVMAFGGAQQPATVTLRNGTWNCGAYSNNLTGLAMVTLANVTVAGAPSTTTTVAPTTTTTQPPATTTTTVAPTTTATTLPPTTTTTNPPATTTTTAAPTTTTTKAPTATTIAAPTTTTSSTVPVYAMSTTTTVPVPPPTTTTTNPPAPPTTTTTSTTVPPTTSSTVPTTTSTTVAVPPTAPTTLPAIPVSTDIGSLSISSPADQSVVQDRVAVRTTVSSPVAVSRVRLYVDGRLLSQDYRAPYDFTWSTRNIAPGSSHALTCVAYDRLGHQIGSQRVTVKVANTVVMAASVAPSEVSAPPTVAETFSDVSVDSSYGSAVATLAEAGVVSGFVDGSFGGDRAMTRAQFAKMLSMSLGIADEDVTQTSFTDLGPIDENQYPHKFVAALSSIGAISGTSGSEFSPWAPITRAQMITIVVRAIRTLEPGALVNLPLGSLSVLGDFSPDHNAAMATAEANGLLANQAGYGPSWDPWAPATRGEAAQMLQNLAGLD